MAGKMKEAVCPPCGLVVKAFDEKDIADLMVYHAKKTHDTIITEKDIKAHLKEAA